jgi:hypothetical protein
VWDKLIACPALAFDPYLSSEEIDLWRLRTIHWFDSLGEEPRTAPKYITMAIAEAFIAETTPKIKDMLSGWEHKLVGEKQLS